MRQVKQELASEAVMIMREQAPSSLKSGRGYRGSPLRDSIKIIPDGKGYFITPTKLVDGYNLGVLLTTGSRNRRIITPKGYLPHRLSTGETEFYQDNLGLRTKKYWLKFVWKGRVYYARMVRRGIIPPNDFIRRSAEHLITIGNVVLRDTFIKYFKEVF